MPQWSRLLVRSTQEPPQFVRKTGVFWQVTSQRPSEQTMPLPHALAQAPQFDLSDMMFTHWPPQLTSPVGQSSVVHPDSARNGTMARSGMRVLASFISFLRSLTGRA